MKKIFLPALFLILLTSCKEKIQKFIFDASKMNILTEYSYEYQSNKLKSSKEITYTIMFGQKADTMVTSTTYEYDEKGLLRKEISKTDFEEAPSIRLFNYNSNDSINRDMLISPEKDTIDWREFIYFPDGRKEVFSRRIYRPVDLKQDFVQSINSKNFDTIIHKTVYQYENNFCRSLKDYDGKNNLTRMIEYDYKDDKLMKETYTSPIKSIVINAGIKYYDYSKSNKFPDYYTLGINNDTIDYCRNTFVNDSLYSTTIVFEHGKFAEKTFYTNSKKIGRISVSKEMNSKTIESYSYYQNGDLKETKTYREEIKNNQ